MLIQKVAISNDWALFTSNILKQHNGVEDEKYRLNEALDPELYLDLKIYRICLLIKLKSHLCS